ncbi:RagB/SusD family nutrient uptake outer membrane protein [Sediminitomix flava]|uniref:Putative outer membrane starch-binding protein n=1 Tax=Sediminitomix flava TaxID=379075 RepID=A0A315ZA43_SEDFL|nr:RagB/SusD family nutrient uptake outer membrane protein [Sediminitomix flava]PWJ41933.1 putative outer membrane starch-binding protein [Sediminitomix flava]
MKQIKFILISLSSILIFSCEAYLDKVEDSGITKDEVFSNYTTFLGHLDYAYKGLFDYHLSSQNTAISTVSDQFQCPSTTAWQDYAQYVNTGLYDNKAGAFEVGWSSGNGYGQAATFYNAMAALRVVNRCIEEAEVSPILTAGQQKEITGQSYFLRAYYHFELIKRYGGMPWIDRVFEADEDLDLPKESYEFITQKIVEDCERAIELLPASRSGFTFGRATATAAYMLKSTALLYDMSPTMNAVNGYSLSYNQTKALEVAKAAAETIAFAEKNGFSLHNGSTIDDYSNIFYSREDIVSTESIFFRLSKGFVGWGGTLKQLYVPRSFGVNSNRYTLATQNLVDMFETTNGLAIEDDPSYDPQNPYKNRDPRLTYSVLYHGAEHGLDEKGKKRIIDFSIDKGGNRNANGIDYNGAGEDLKSGYYMRKFLPKTANNWAQDGDYFMNWTYMRLTQAYLDFAEAANEAVGPTGQVEGSDLTALEAINIVRARVGMPEVNAVYTSDKEIFRTRIWNERSVELNGEFQRWWDMRRWHIAHLSAQKSIKGVKVVRDNNTGEETFETIDVVGARRVFDEKHYWYPWPRDMIFMLENFEQNPGW